MPKEKIFKLKLRLEEIIMDEDMIVFPIFSNSQTISGIDQIKTTLDNFKEQLHKFIDTILIPNDKKG